MVRDQQAKETLARAALSQRVSKLRWSSQSSRVPGGRRDGMGIGKPASTASSTEPLSR